VVTASGPFDLYDPAVQLFRCPIDSSAIMAALLSDSADHRHAAVSLEHRSAPCLVDQATVRICAGGREIGLVTATRANLLNGVVKWRRRQQ
jgi:hypothetical protein